MVWLLFFFHSNFQRWFSDCSPLVKFGFVQLAANSDYGSWALELVIRIWSNLVSNFVIFTNASCKIPRVHSWKFLLLSKFYFDVEVLTCFSKAIITFEEPVFVLREPAIRVPTFRALRKIYTSVILINSNYIFLISKKKQEF